MKTKTFFLFLLIFGLGISTAGATSYDLKEITPDIQQAISNRQGRYEMLRVLKQSGAVGENNKGYLSVLRPTSDAEVLVKSENEDRRTIYQAIVEQNNLGPGGMEAVETVFAEVKRDQADSGHVIQLPAGGWKTV